MVEQRCVRATIDGAPSVSIESIVTDSRVSSSSPTLGGNARPWSASRTLPGNARDDRWGQRNRTGTARRRSSAGCPCRPTVEVSGIQIG
jgi:hypothetical protein